MPRQAIFKAKDPNSTLPDLELAPPPIKDRYFTWELLPWDATYGKHKILIKCTTKNCNYESNQSWPLNTDNLKSHYKSKHTELLRVIDSTVKDNNYTPNFLDIKPLDEGDIRGFLTIDPDNRVIKKRRSNQDISNYGNFNINKFIDLLLDFIIFNNLPFAIVNSESFRTLLSYLKLNIDFPSRQSIRRAFTRKFNENFEEFIKEIRKNNSRFSLTFDEWKAGNNFDFLAITLHFFDRDFNLISRLIGFEALNKNISYSGEVLFNSFNTLLSRINIRNRILGVTRDNASPCGALFKEAQKQYKKAFNIDIINISCAAHVANLISNAFLKYTFFIKDNSKSYYNTLNTLATTNPGFEKRLDIIKLLPSRIRGIINAIRFNHFLKNTFKRLVENKNKALKSKKGFEELLRDNDTRWLSKWAMLDRFIYFRKEIASLALKVNDLPKSKQKNIKIDLNISEEDWNYIISIRDILEPFRKPTIKFQANKYEVISLTLLYYKELLNKINKAIINEVNILNPYITYGLVEAKRKLLEYYPIEDTTTIDINNKLAPTKTISFNKLKVLYLTSILDPHIKRNGLEYLGFSPKVLEETIDYLRELYNTYRDNIESGEDQFILNESQTTSSSSNPFNEEITSDDELLGLHTRSFTRPILRDEIIEYLAEGEVSFTTIKTEEFWRLNKSKYPILYNIARDYLAIMPSSAPSESEFSKAGDIVTKKRNRLKPDTIRQLTILKSWGKINDEEETINDNIDPDEDLVDSDKDITTISKDKGKAKDKSRKTREDNNLDEEIYTDSPIESEEEEDSTTSNSNSESEEIDYEELDNSDYESNSN